jgi:Na+-transporting methylmalonyl-CoA/oxaloacetate decarboxylase gamma subunit
MKKLNLILLLILPLLLLAADNVADKNNSLSVRMDLKETALHLDIPVKQLKIYLELDPNTDPGLTLEELHISKRAVNKALQNYNNSKQSFYTSIIIIGMLIVFASLIIVGLIIDRMKLLRHLEKKQRKPSASLANFTAQGSNKPSQNDVIAAITTIYLHELEAEEENKLLLTWKRASISLWNAAGKLNMPNRIFFKELRR